MLCPLYAFSALFDTNTCGINYFEPVCILKGFVAEKFSLSYVLVPLPYAFRHCDRIHYTLFSIGGVVNV